MNGPNYRGVLAGFEDDCILTPMNAGDEADGGAKGYALVSIAISLKRIADALDPAADLPPRSPPSPSCPQSGDPMHDIFDCPICRPF